MQPRQLDHTALELEWWPHGSDRDVWMIIDGARDKRIYFDVINSHLDSTCLYSGDLSPDLEHVAPYLVQLEMGDKYSRDLISRGWDYSWGVFLRSGTTMEKLRRHLRTLLTVKDWTGRKLLFRYYDPRVLRNFLPTCTSEELKTVFGPVQKFWTEAEGGQYLLRFEFAKGRLVETEVAATSCPAE